MPLKPSISVMSHGASISRLPDDTIEFDLYIDNNYDVLAGVFEQNFGVKSTTTT